MTPAPRPPRLDSLADLYRIMVEKSPHGVFVVDDRDRCIYVNETGCRMAGHPVESLLGRDLLAMLPVDLHARGRAYFAAARRSAIAAVELPFPDPDGEHRWWEVATAPVGLDRFVAYATDIAASRAQREKLLDEKQHLDRAATVARVGWWEFDLKNDRVVASDGACAIYGLAPGTEASIADVHQIPLPEHRTELDAALRDLVAGTRPYDVIFRIRRRDDGCLAEVRSVAEYDAGRRRVFGILQDLTEVRRLEDQLRQAQKMEAVGRLAGGIAHDFNNLLTPIIGFADMLIETYDPDDPHREDLAIILRAAERARDLTAQLLAFGRKQFLDVRTVCLNDIVRESEPMLRRLLRENIQLNLRLAPDPAAVRADVSQLHNVLINLVVNAADAMPSGGVLGIETLAVDLDQEYARAHPGTLAGRHMALVVSDDGCGMDAETLAVVFEPFFTTKRLHEGTGLGLATVHGIVKQHQGSIQVYSEPGHGTVFKIYLPEVAGPPEPLPADAEPPRLHGHERILLVEDDEAVRSMAAAALARFGYTAVPAASPAAALQAAADAAERCDLLVTDVVMPGMNGPQLHRALCDLWPGLPALFMSGYTSNVIAHHGILAEGLHFLTKPFTPHDLAAKVRRVLDG